VYARGLPSHRAHGIPMELLRRIFGSIGGAELSQTSSYFDLRLGATRGHAVARNSSCTLGQGSGARVLYGAPSASVLRSKIAAWTEGRARMRAHQSAMAGYSAHRPPSLRSSSRRM